MEAPFLPPTPYPSRPLHQPPSPKGPQEACLSPDPLLAKRPHDCPSPPTSPLGKWSPANRLLFSVNYPWRLPHEVHAFPGGAEAAQPESPPPPHPEPQENSRKPRAHLEGGGPQPSQKPGRSDEPSRLLTRWTPTLPAEPTPLHFLLSLPVSFLCLL